jgi:hypothetical protein
VYTVTLIVTDDDGASDTVYYDLEVVDPQQATMLLIEMVKECGLDKGLENSYISILENTIKSMDKSKWKTSVNQLNAFINHVEAQSGKKLTEGEADGLIPAAEWIIGHIES